MDDIKINKHPDHLISMFFSVIIASLIAQKHSSLANFLGTRRKYLPGIPLVLCSPPIIIFSRRKTSDSPRLEKPAKQPFTSTLLSLCPFHKILPQPKPKPKSMPKRFLSTPRATLRCTSHRQQSILSNHQSEANHLKILQVLNFYFFLYILYSSCGS